MMAAPRIYLVESIPGGLEDLRGTAGVDYTEHVLVRLTEAAQSSIDLTAMYWALLADPDSDDEKGFSRDQLDAMGAGAGKALYDALRKAAGRGVNIRILESPGFSGQKQESATLLADFPNQVTIRPITMGDWYGGSGIMHQKIWIFDAAHLYLGSANMDWKSIAQVKEMGVAVENCPDLIADAQRYFAAWWALAGMPPSGVAAFDPAARIFRTVPAWSQLVPSGARVPSPFATPAFAALYDRLSPLALTLGDSTGDFFLTGAPAEICAPNRTTDEDGLVFTIDDARRSVCVSVMDFAPASIYGRKKIDPAALDGALQFDNTPVWWPALYNALLSAVLTRKVYVRLLVSKWAHTSGLIEPFLRALQAAADAGRADKYMIAGQLEIKEFIVPGWDSTAGASRKYPGHTRVNHAKYIVTDRRINIGTSNMTWDYFSSTAGSSFNSSHPALVHDLQAVFDRDWSSSYAWHLS